LNFKRGGEDSGLNPFASEIVDIAGAEAKKSYFFVLHHFPHGILPREMDIDAALSRGEIEFVQTSGSTERKSRSYHSSSAARFSIGSA
jgi:hypothetical protein